MVKYTKTLTPCLWAAFIQPGANGYIQIRFVIGTTKHLKIEIRVAYVELRFCDGKSR